MATIRKFSALVLNWMEVMMDTNMSTMTFAEMTAKVATLTHRELVELMGVIVNQLRLEDNTSKDKLGS